MRFTRENIQVRGDIILTLLLVAICTSNVECGRQRTTSAGNQCVCGATNWMRFTPPKSRFSALMPTSPVEAIYTNETPAGPLVISTYTSEVSSTVAFAIACNSFPTNWVLSDTKKVFAGGLQQALGDDGHLISESEVLLKGYLGREWRFDKIQGKAIVVVRAYLVDHQFFQAICVMPKDRVCEQHVRVFLDSCELADNELLKVKAVSDK